MRSVDTNVLVRLLVRDDPRQTAAAERFVQSGAWVSLLVLLETVWVLSSVYSLGPKQINSIVEMLLEHRDLVLQDADVVAAANALSKERGAPELPDCLFLALARKSGHLPLATFDRKLGALDGSERL